MSRYKVLHHEEGEQLTLLELGPSGDVAEGDIRPKLGSSDGQQPGGDRSQNGLVLICTWRRCWLVKRPKSGRCANCSQVVELWAGALTAYHRVVDGRM